jgi:hypothetical protein
VERPDRSAPLGFAGLAFLVSIIARPWLDGSERATRNAVDELADQQALR